MNKSFYDCSIKAFERLTAEGDIHLFYNGDDKPITSTQDYKALTGEPFMAVIRLLLSITAETSTTKVFEGDVSAYWIRRSE